MESLISKELVESDQETLKSFCRSGDQEDKAEGLVEKIAIAALNAIVVKNELVRQVSVPGHLRMFAVDEKKVRQVRSTAQPVVVVSVESSDDGSDDGSQGPAVRDVVEAES